ncbi:MAG: hypothetical protein K2X08_01910, partial [Chlamydiales bacterium]|nr:hypothetical protein [Chlamydiales bacterium]
MIISNTDYCQSFQPSLLAKTLSQITAPGALAACAVLGTTIMGGASWWVAMASAGLTIAAERILADVISEGTLRASVFIEADRLSLETVQEGGLLTITIPPVLEGLAAVPSKESRIAKNCLESILNYENYFNLLGIANHVLVSDFINKISELKPGQQIGTSFSWLGLRNGSHIILGSIERKENGRFIVRFHNGGDGLEYHYNMTHSTTRTKLYQTTLEIDEVEEENLALFMKQVASLRAVGLNHDSSKVYEAILSLKGNILPPRKDPRFWSREQIGSSCSGFAIRCFLQTLLTPEDLTRFDLQFLSL